MNRPRRTLAAEPLESREVPAGFAYPDFSSTAGLTLVGSAAVNPSNQLRLTPAVSSQGAAWYTAEKMLVAGSFDTTFRFRLSTATGGSDGSDGFAFVIQNSSPTELRQGGGGLGYNTMPNSVAVEFDTHLNNSIGEPWNDPSQSHVSVHTNGTGANDTNEAFRVGPAYNTPGFLLDDAQWHTARVSYTSGTLRVYLDNLSTPVVTAALDLNTTLALDAGRAWVGFTGAAGGSPLNQDFADWTFTATDNVVVADSPSVVEGNAGTAPVTFTLTRHGSLSGEVAVNWATANGTAEAGSDYAAASGQVVFADGESVKTVTVNVIGDAAEESSETFRLVLATPPSHAGITGQATTLNDDVTVSVGDAAVTEGEAGFRFFDAFVTQGSGGMGSPMGVTFGPDGNLYVSHEGSGHVLRFDAHTGQFLGAFNEPASTETSQLVFHDGYLFAATGASGILRFDGTTGAPAPAPGKPGALFAAPAEQGVADGVHGLAFGPDGNLYITSNTTNAVLRYDGTSGAFIDTFVSAGSGGLAVANALVFGTDGRLYVASSGTDSVLRYRGPLESNPGAFVDTFVAPAAGGLDWIPAAGMRFGPDGDLYVSSRDTNSVLRFRGTTGGFVDTAVGSGGGGLGRTGGLTFDGEGRLYVASRATRQVLRYGPASQAVFTVSLSSASATPVTVNFATANGSATAGSDYTAVSGTVTFAPGQTTRTVLVTTLNDTAAETPEAFTLILSNPAGATIADGTGVGTIADDDATKFFVVNDGSPDQTFRYSSPGNGLGSSTLGSGNTAPRGAASTAAGDRVWVADANKKVYVYDAAGNPLGSWTAGSLASNAQVEGITVWGNDVWIVDARQDRVYRYAGAATRLSGTQNATSSFALNSGNKDPKDLVTDGASIWVVNDSTADKVFKYTLAGSHLGNWTMTGGGGSPTGITLDPSAPVHLWVVDNATDRVYQFDNAVGRTSGSQPAATSFALAAGNTNPQGIADPPVPSGGAAGPRRPAAPPSPGIAADWLTDDEDDYDYAPINVDEGPRPSRAVRG